MTLTLDKTGRLAVPKQWRDRLAIKPGDELEVVFEDGSIRLSPAIRTSAVTKKKGILICSSQIPASVRDVGAFINKQREKRHGEIGGM